MTESTHIAEETLERYALGTLGTEERARVEAHAAGCAACREALRRESVIAAGIRMAGREEMKRSLARRIAARERPRRRWRVMAAAASLALLVGSGLYIAWLDGRAPAIAPPSPVAGNQVSPPAALRRDESLAEGGVHAEHVPPAAAPAGSGAPRVVKSLALPQNAPSENERAEEQVKRMAAAYQARGFWTEGVVEEAPSNETGMVESGAARAQGAAAFKKEAQELKADAAKDALAGARQEYRLRQEPASALPAGMGAKQRQAEPRVVHARVVERGSTTTMTLYLDTLVDDAELKGATVRQAGSDSVIVELGRRKILYRIPGSAPAQQQK